MKHTAITNDNAFRLTVNANETKVFINGSTTGLFDILTDQEGDRYFMFDGKAVYFTSLVECHRNPTQSEINFGYGAIHYRDFTAAEIGYNKSGELKQWFKADDGLRYYRF